MARSFLLGFLLVLLVLPAPANKGPNTLRPYSALELLEIENQRNEKGRKIPDEFVPRLAEDLRYALVDLHLFRRLDDFMDEKVPQPAVERIVQMKVRIVDYSGAQNNASVAAMVHFFNKETGREIFQQRVGATLRYDQGATTSALRKLTRSIAGLVRSNW